MPAQGRWPAPSPRSARPALLTDGADELGLAHLRAALDPELGGFAAKLGDGHRPRAAARALRGASLARGRLRALASEVATRLAREIRDRLLLARSGLGLLHVLLRRLALLLRGHLQLFFASTARLSWSLFMFERPSMPRSRASL